MCKQTDSAPWLPALHYPCPQVTNQNGLQWVGEALAGIPDEAATSADKQRFMTACQQVGWARAERGCRCWVVGASLGAPACLSWHIRSAVR